MKLSYRPDLKQKARTLRTNMTDAEQLLWFHLRRKQMQGIPFYRQRPIAHFIVDFFAPAIRLAIEVDGGQHFEPAGLGTDAKRTGFLGAREIEVIRFDNLQVLKETPLVLEEIYRVVQRRKSLPASLLQREECPLGI